MFEIHGIYFASNCRAVNFSPMNVSVDTRSTTFREIFIFRYVTSHVYCRYPTVNTHLYTIDLYVFGYVHRNVFSLDLFLLLARSFDSYGYVMFTVFIVFAKSLLIVTRGERVKKINKYDLWLMRMDYRRYLFWICRRTRVLIRRSLTASHWRGAIFQIVIVVRLVKHNRLE